MAVDQKWLTEGELEEAKKGKKGALRGTVRGELGDCGKKKHEVCARDRSSRLV